MRKEAGICIWICGHEQINHPFLRVDAEMLLLTSTALLGSKSSYAVSLPTTDSITSQLTSTELPPSTNSVDRRLDLNSQCLHLRSAEIISEPRRSQSEALHICSFTSCVHGALAQAGSRALIIIVVLFVRRHTDDPDIFGIPGLATRVALLLQRPKIAHRWHDRCCQPVAIAAACVQPSSMRPFLHSSLAKVSVSPGEQHGLQNICGFVQQSVVSLLDPAL